VSSASSEGSKVSGGTGELPLLMLLKMFPQRLLCSLSRSSSRVRWISTSALIALNDRPLMLALEFPLRADSNVNSSGRFPNPEPEPEPEPGPPPPPLLVLWVDLLFSGIRRARLVLDLSGGVLLLFFGRQLGR
jgi:hypothetical protein